jgi:hypothetical protein
MPALTLEEARTILGDDLLGPSEVERAFGSVGPPSPIPFTRDDIVAARRAGDMLVLRTGHGGDALPLTVLQMIQQYPEAFDSKLLRQVGYQLKDEWGIMLEPRAATDTCAPGWALVRKEILDDSRNLLYAEQEAAIRRHAAAVGVSVTALRRRSAVEAVYDVLLYYLARGVRLLDATWDWSQSPTVDGGFLNVGGFSAKGMQILSFSQAVRHGALGVCPTRAGD